MIRSILVFGIDSFWELFILRVAWVQLQKVISALVVESIVASLSNLVDVFLALVFFEMLFVHIYVWK